MNIINKSANVASSFDLYKLVQSPERKKLTDIKGQTITLDKWVLYTEPDKDGKEMKLLALTTADGSAYCTNSASSAAPLRALSQCLPSLAKSSTAFRLSLVLPRTTVTTSTAWLSVNQPDEQQQIKKKG